MGALLLIILILFLVGALPTWGHSSSWGYGPAGLLILVLLVLLILMVTRSRPFRKPLRTIPVTKSGESVKRLLGSLPLFLSWACLLQAQELSLPAEVKGERGRLLAVEIGTDAAQVEWQLAGRQVDAFREYAPGFQGVKLRLIGYADGEYWLFVAAAKDGKIVTRKCPVIIGVAPGPPEPPGPKPPDPPGPRPPGPATFEGKLLAAYQADGKPAAAAKTLADLYWEVTQPPNADPNILSPGGPVWQAQYATAGALGARIKALADAKLPDRNKYEFYKVIAGELAAKLAVSSAQLLTAELRQRISSEYVRVAEALGKLP